MAFLTSSSAFAEYKNPKVVVIGAGLAGLTTAYRLQQQGMDVHVYEARNRVGGRVFTAKINGQIAELGGENISDGGDAKNLHSLIKEFDLKLKYCTFDLSHSYFNGERFIPINPLLQSQQFDPKHLKSQLDDLAQQSKNMRDVLNGLFEEDDPLYKTLAVRLAAYEGCPIRQIIPYLC